MQVVSDRLAMIPALTGRIHPVAKLADLMERGGLAQATPAAFVLPLGLRGGAATAAAGLYRQNLERFVGVVLAVRHVGDATGALAQAALDPLIDAVIGMLAGWGTDDMIGVFTLSRGELAGIDKGTITYQLDFAIEDQLRIVR